MGREVGMSEHDEMKPCDQRFSDGLTRRELLRADLAMGGIVLASGILVGP